MTDVNAHYQSKNQRISEEEITEYIFQRFQDIKRLRKIKDVVAFHTANKYMLMAHNQAELKKLGKIVADYKKQPFSEILIEYENHLRLAMLKNPTVKTHSNVIMHIFGYFSKNLNQDEKKLFFDLLEKFREHKITIGKILLEISPIAYRFDNTYLAGQTYFLLYSDIEPTMLFHALDNKSTDEFTR